MKRPSPAAVLTFSLVGISFAGPLTALSHSDPLIIGAWRLMLSLVIVAIALVITGEWRDWRRLTIRDAGFSVLAGIALAFHFWAWNASLRLTTIAASVTLVNLQPAFIIAISTVFLREWPSKKQLLGVIVAIAGAMIIGAPALMESGSSVGSGAALGNILALSAAVAAAIYYSVGRHLRHRYGLWSYVGLAYSACALTLVAAAHITHLAIFPQPV